MGNLTAGSGDVCASATELLAPANMLASTSAATLAARSALWNEARKQFSRQSGRERTPGLCHFISGRAALMLVLCARGRAPLLAPCVPAGKGRRLLATAPSASTLTFQGLLRARALRHVRERGRLLFGCAVVLVLALAWRGTHVGNGANPDQALRTWLARNGYTLAGDDLVWLEPPQGSLALRPALFVAHRDGELDDVYYADVRASEHVVHDVFLLTDLTRSSSAVESGLTRIGTHVAFSVRIGPAAEAVVVLDTRGEPRALTRDWPWYARIQNTITNLQETSRPRGMGRAHYRLQEPAQALSLRVDNGRFAIDADGARIALVPGVLQPSEGGERVEAVAQSKGQPGTFTWLVDTVRNVSFIGPAPIAWLEHTVFGLTDRVTRAYYEIFGVQQQDKEMQDALVAGPAPPPPPPPPPPPEPSAAQALLTAGSPDLAWPPAHLQHVLPDVVHGEGEWLPTVDEAFVNAYPHAPPAFYQTFIRVDPERPYVSVYVTMWDPRQVQLHVVMGTAEPESATGETGSGIIPRDPELLSRLVAGFNGGFQAMHGEFGMMAEGRVYLPPKPYAATVAVFDDGRVGMGSWPGPTRGRDWDEESANAQIPPDMIAMRQNLTSVVEDGVANPWQRWWWGAAPEWAEEQTFIVRSGLCVTQEGHMAFLWGDSMGPDQLAKAMLALRCVRGMHLDMNSKHTGLELYRPFAPNHPPSALGRPLTEQEHEGPIENGQGFIFRTRLAVKLMTPLRFPRYLERDPRDYFFLSLKSVLPGPDVTVGGTPLAFNSDGLPNSGWPHAFARALLPTGDSGTDGAWFVRIDPARALPAPLAPADATRPLARLVGLPASDNDADAALFVAHAEGSALRYRVGQPPAQAVIVLRGRLLTADAPARRALGVDREGFIVYAEVTEADAPQLPAWLAEVGVERALALPDRAALGFAIDDQLVAVDGGHTLDPGDGASLAWMAETRPAASVMFPEVKPRPYYHWAGLQGQRVRYFPANPPRFRAPEEALAPTPAPAD